MECLHPITIKNPRCKSNPAAPRYISVPCGKCVCCIDRKAKDWSFRIQQELKRSSGAIFVTLTYDEEHEPKGENVCKRDVQLFLKRLRKHVSFRYFLVAEYGPNTFRPHYHAIFFNIKRTKLNVRYIEKSWQNGFVSVSNITPGRIAYVCRYSFKPANIPDGRTNTFLLASRRPAIGSNFLTSQMVSFLKDSPRVVIDKGSTKIRIPEYYKRKVYNSEELDIIRHLGEEYRRKVAKHRDDENSSVEEFERLNYDRKVIQKNRLLAKYLKKMNPKKL